MARNRTATGLIDDVRRRADIENVTRRFPDDEVLEYINQSIARLYTILDRCDDTYYQKRSNITTTSGTGIYALPLDFWTLKQVAVQVSNNIQFVARQYMLSEGPWLQTIGVWSAGFPVYYRICSLAGVGGDLDGIEFAPRPTGNYVVTITYAKSPQRLGLGNDFFDGKAGYEEWVILDAAIKARRKQNTDATALMADKMEVENWILSSANRRDQSSPQRVTDSQTVDYFRWPWNIGTTT